jgi:hypothetical protein
MDNQHRKIIGYRELNEDEIARMNEIRAPLSPIHAGLPSARRTSSRD